MATALLTLGLAAISASPASAAGANLYVDPSGTDAGDCQTLVTPCQTIQYAVDQATDGDTVNVAAGTYAENVVSAKSLTFLGANAGVAAGVSPGVRGPESVVKTIRTASGGPGTTPYDVTIDGFTLDPQGDATVRGGTAALVSLRGGTGTGTSVVNNVFTGNATFVPGCFSETAGDCGMAYSALEVELGTVVVADNTVENFRYGVRLVQATSTALNGTVDDNVVSGVSIQGIAIGANAGIAQAPSTVTDNEVSATGYLSQPAGVLLLNADNTVTGNTFTDLGAGVYVDLCKLFDTRGNDIDDNTFVNAGIVIATSFLASCQTGSGGDAPGVGNWVVGGGQFTGLTANGNSFSGSSAGITGDTAARWSPNVPNNSGTLDVTCNWWGSASGPTAAGNPSGTGVALIAAVGANQPSYDYESWEIADGGACTGTVPAPTGPIVNLGYAQAVEPETGVRAAFVPVFLSEPSASPTTISFFTVDDSAVGGQDYTVWGTPTAPRSITIPAGTLQGTINVPVRADNDTEADEDFFVVVASVSVNATLGDSTAGAATILDSDVFGGNPVVAVTSGTLYEGDTGVRRAQFNIQLSEPAAGLAVAYNTVDGTALSGTNFTPKLPGTVTFSGTTIQRTIDVQVPSNVISAADLDFFLQGVVTGGPAVEEISGLTGQMTILNDD